MEWKVIHRREVLDTLERNNTADEYDDVMREKRPDQKGEAMYKRRREEFESGTLNDDGSIKEGQALTPLRPWFLSGRWKKKKTGDKNNKNWFKLDVDPLDDPRSTIFASQITDRHPAIMMGLHYSLRWYWMGMCNTRGITPSEIQEQRDGIGWKGPEEWPKVPENKVAPFTSLWLIRNNNALNKHFAEQLPRVVASPNFYGKERYDCVCCKMETDDGVEDWIAQVVMLFMAPKLTNGRNADKWEELAYVRWFRDVERDDIDNHRLKPVRDENEVIWKRVLHLNKAGMKMMVWSEPDENAFAPFPYTTGWGVVPCASISHRVLMHPVHHASMGFFFWMNESMYR